MHTRRGKRSGAGGWSLRKPPGVINRLGIISLSGGSQVAKLRDVMPLYAGQTHAFLLRHLRAHHSHQPGLLSVTGCDASCACVPALRVELSPGQWAQWPTGRLGLSVAA